MRRYIRMISHTAACLLAALLVFASCQKSDNNTEGLDIPDSATRCLLQPPTIGVMPFGAGSPATRAAQAIKEEQQAFNVGEELGNIITLGNSPVEETPQTRTLTSGAYCRIVIYKLEDWNNGTMKIAEQRLCKQGSTDYFAELGDSTEPIYLYPGSYKIFCYSFNKTSTEKMTPLADGTANVPLVEGDDFLSTVVDKTITFNQLNTNVSLGTITLQHRCCQLIGILKSSEFNGSSGIASSPAPTLSAVSTFTTQGNWSIKDTRFTPSASTAANTAKAFTLTAAGESLSDTLLILPFTNQALKANYNFKPTGSNVTAAATGKSVATSATFASGGSYSVTIKAIGAYVITSGVTSLKIGDNTWATRNVRWNNTFETNLKIWESGNLRGASQSSNMNEGVNSDWNSYFMWGSKTAYVSGELPKTSSTWPSSTNPCPSGYKVPTQAQLTNLMAKKIPEGSKVSINGETFTINNAFGFYNGTKARGLVLMDGRNVLFLPAAGEISGSRWFSVSVAGYYWSNEYDSNGPYSLLFSNGMCVVRNTNRKDGLSVRCVK